MAEFFTKYIKERASVLYLEFSESGHLLNMNSYAKKLIGEKKLGGSAEGIFIDFHNELNFKELFTESSDPKMLHINTVNDFPETFYFYFYQEQNRLLAFGEQNQQETDLLKKEILIINNELDQLTRELHKKNSELKKLNEIKDQFLAIAAHDLRNPVGNIITMSDYLINQLNDKLNDQHLKFLSLIKSLGEFGLKLLNELLDLIKIESGNINLNYKEIDLLLLIRKTIESNELEAENKNILLTSHHLLDFNAFFLDESAIQQVLNNLISNAIKYSPGGTKIEVGTFYAEDYVTVYVKDQGPGIPDAEVQKIFVPFSRTSNRPTGGEKSTGLGLSIAQKIVISHGGKIWIRSKMGEGTTFYFSLPVLKEIPVQ